MTAEPRPFPRQYNAVDRSRFWTKSIISMPIIWQMPKTARQTADTAAPQSMTVPRCALVVIILMERVPESRVAAMTGNQPVALVLTRQDLPLYEKSGKDALKGGYVLSDCEGTPDVLLMASGSEVEQCMGAQELLKAEGVKARVISMPSFELFEAQSDEYKESVMPKAVRARVAVEAAATFGWHKYVGLDGAVVGMERFGASAPAKIVFERLGFTVAHVLKVAEGLFRQLGK